MQVVVVFTATCCFFIKFYQNPPVFIVLNNIAKILYKFSKKWYNVLYNFIKG